MTTGARQCEMYIDGDGVPFWLIELAIEEVRGQFHDVRVRAYKDWLDPGNNGLLCSLADLAVEVVQVAPHAKLQNATDIALTVDAVATHHTAPSGWVALVGNDGDFTPLVDHLTKDGVGVIGFGSRDASARLASSCDRFVHYDPAVRRPVDLTTEMTPEEAVGQVVAACAGEDGWLPLTQFGTAIRAAHGLRCSDLGASTWSRYLDADPRFELARDSEDHPLVRHRTGAHAERG